jgi:hypothetical protein
VDGARIRVRRADGQSDTRSAAAWAERLPPIDAVPPEGMGAQRATIRVVESTVPVRDGKRLIGWAERFGPHLDATVRLLNDRIRVTTDSGDAFDWPLEALTAIQPSSATLQLKTRETLLSVRFHEDSVRRWEAVLCAAVRRRYSDLGRGGIVEFQPRIRSR